MSENPTGGSSRRTVLKTVGVAACGVGALSTATAGSGALGGGRSGALGGRSGALGGHPLAVDEKNMPVEEARCWTVNGSDTAVDFYLNGASQPYVSDVQPLSIGPVVVLDGTADLPYGTHTVEVRPKGQPDAEVLAAASVDFEEGNSLAAAFYRVDTGEYELSIYQNDYSPTEDARLVVRNVSSHETVDWNLYQNSETPETPDDPRSGTLGQGQWQEAADVAESDYVLEAFVDGELVTVHVDLELEVETTYVVYVVGEPGPLNIDPANDYAEASDSGLDEAKWLLAQGFEVVPGDDEADVVTAPSEPLSTTDQNQAIQFDCQSLEVYETNVLETEVAATDPDGYVTGLALDSVDPPTDGITMVDNSVDRAVERGGTTTATLRVGPAVPPDSYEVRVVANPESIGAEATCSFTITTEEMHVARLYDLVDQYQLSDDVEQPIATDLNALLDEAQAHLDAGETTQACAALSQFTDLVGSNKDAGVSETAHDDLQAEAEALKLDLNCG